MNQEVVTKLAKYCSHTERCELEIREKATTLGANEDELPEMLEWLQAESFWNETRYIQAFIHDKIKFNLWGERKIGMHLKQKNIEIPVWRKIEQDLELRPLYFENIDTLIRRKKRDLGVDSIVDFKVKAKVYNYLIQRGFSSTHILEKLGD